MPDSPTRSGQPSSVSGGASTVPTPANNVNGPESESASQGQGHVDPSNARATMGEFLGLRDQKTRAENKYNARADLAAGSIKPTTEKGEPTCATEDHSFMGVKPGGNDTWPGWDTLKNIVGK